ncbi:hypothetical protein [Pusillimonas minor]|uniref:Uncharacterized protein n=1 Tax=Pusillimonas minor TaxID=2697024 RepID=A0A842HK09_9BURK|nr:hypothetical protein [Pusillimonas minor]MBC2768563.1 hypothetical protein [Pusillimonas minor]
MNDVYSPHTGEHIITDNPAPWMGRAGVDAPLYDPVAQGCFWRGDALEVVDVQDDPGPVPESATPAQGLMALYQLKGITEADIEAAIEGITDPAQRYTAQIAYRKTTLWQRHSQSMATIAALLGLTEQDLDDLFRLAPSFLL